VPFPEGSVYKEVIEEKPLHRVKMFYKWSIIILQYNKVNSRVSIFSRGLVFFIISRFQINSELVKKASRFIGISQKIVMVKKFIACRCALCPPTSSAVADYVGRRPKRSEGGYPCVAGLQICLGSRSKS
jgi:hypothetical protein